MACASNLLSLQMPLVGCPFCRELYTESETNTCPVCGVPLAPMEKLPPSYEARVAQAAELAATPPEDRVMPWYYWKRNRAALIVVAVLGLVAFCSPWIDLRIPDEIELSGYALARAHGSWFFGSAIGWFVMIPLVASRRTVYKMRGVRIIIALFASLSVVEAGEMLLHPPHGSHLRPLAFDWGYGIYATLALGALGMVLATRFGGSIDDIDASELVPEDAPDLSPDASDERTLH